MKLTLFICLFAFSALGGCTQMAGTYGYARGPAASLSGSPEMHPWCSGNSRVGFPQCGQGN